MVKRTEVPETPPEASKSAARRTRSISLSNAEGSDGPTDGQKRAKIEQGTADRRAQDKREKLLAGDNILNPESSPPPPRPQQGRAGVATIQNDPSNTTSIGRAASFELTSSGNFSPLLGVTSPYKSTFNVTQKKEKTPVKLRIWSGRHASGQTTDGPTRDGNGGGDSEENPWREVFRFLKADGSGLSSDVLWIADKRKLEIFLLRFMQEIDRATAIGYSLFMDQVLPAEDLLKAIMIKTNKGDMGQVRELVGRALELFGNNVEGRAQSLDDSRLFFELIKREFSRGQLKLDFQPAKAGWVDLLSKGSTTFMKTMDRAQQLRGQELPIHSIEDYAKDHTERARRIGLTKVMAEQQTITLPKFNPKMSVGIGSAKLRISSQPANIDEVPSVRDVLQYLLATAVESQELNHRLSVQLKTGVDFLSDRPIGTRSAKESAFLDGVERSWGDIDNVLRRMSLDQLGKDKIVDSDSPSATGEGGARDMVVKVAYPPMPGAKLSMIHEYLASLLQGSST
ncbi:hypothetical protein ONS96_005280 [Cadophora gregata f. sp. sojae]|nr:hypothetical protein ONS96_005280 [Cadophora gregata f. sp. sojae]